MEWEQDMKKYLKGLEEKKPVIFCGDLNVAHNEIGRHTVRCKLLCNEVNFIQVHC